MKGSGETRTEGSSEEEAHALERVVRRRGASRVRWRYIFDHSSAVILRKISQEDAEVARMEMERKLRKVGGSVMVPIPPEMLDELQLRVDQPVRLISESGGIRIEPSVPRPSPEVVEFAAKFMDEYEEVLRELANR